MSKGIGIVIVLVGMLFPPEAVFSAIFVIMLGAALKISGTEIDSKVKQTRKAHLTTSNFSEN